MNNHKSLGVAYAIKSKNKKKMADGGAVTASAKTEKRPMPEQRAADSIQTSYASGKKPSRTPSARPKLVGSDAFSVRYSDEIDQDLHRPSSEGPDGGSKQPKSSYDEEQADQQGTTTESIRMKMLADGGEVEDDEIVEPRMQTAGDASRLDNGFGKVIMKAHGGEVEDSEAEEEQHSSVAAAIMARTARKMAEGGRVDTVDSADLKENDDEDMMDVSQPMDSNEDDREISDEDEAGMSKIQKIMRRSANRSPMNK